MSFLGPALHRVRVFFVGILSVPGFPQFHTCTAEFFSDAYGRVSVRFHPNHIQVNNGVVQQIINPNVVFNVAPPLAAFRIETPNAFGVWAPLQFNAVFASYRMDWGPEYRIYVGGVLWELWRPQLQMSRQAYGPGQHNVALQ